MNNALRTFTRKEILIRVIGILVVSMLFPLGDVGGIYSKGNMVTLSIISIIRTTLLWHGSILIISYALMRFPILKQPIKLISFQLIFLLLLVFIVEIAEIYSIEIFTKQTLERDIKVSFIFISMLVTFLINSIYAAVSFFIQWKTDFLRVNALEQAKLEARYETLKTQVNPHFLFNSLNTLLMLVRDNPVASKYIESVSEFMRYMLNSQDKDVVLLRDELKIAREYAYIQQSRFGNKLQFNFNIGEAYFHYAIPPLSLQMLIENCIKHNIASNEKKLVINIYISDNQYLVVENIIQPKFDKEPSTGVGLENIRNRYLYLSSKEVIVNQNNGKFIVALPLFEKSI
jgi:sensor histidine kinase YesM